MSVPKPMSQTSLIVATSLFFACLTQAPVLATDCAAPDYCSAPTVLTNPNEGPNDAFGSAVSRRGAVLVVGAPREDCTAGIDCGAAYIFRNVNNAWSMEQRLSRANAAINDRFGTSVGVDGDWIVVGTPNRDCVAGPDCGEAYVYHNDGGSWHEAATLTALTPTARAKFGTALAIDGNVIVVGSPSESCDSGQGCGAGYVFRFDGQNWISDGAITPSDRSASQSFGTSVAIYEDTVVVGAPGADTQSATSSGAAYVFQVNAGVWTQEAKLQIPTLVTNDQFGVDVSLNGNRIVCGAPNHGCLSGGQCGTAYLFERQSYGNFQARIVTHSLSSNGFGTHVALGNEILAVNDFVILHLFEPQSGSWLEILHSSMLNGSGPASFDGHLIALGIPSIKVLLAGSDGVDCDCNGTADACEIGDQSKDCNGNHIPDVCDLTSGSSQDCDSDLIPDECELVGRDCNGNGVLDSCDLASGTSQDCDADQVPDECELAKDPTQDCNGNHLLDSCDIWEQRSRDVDHNNVPDECEVPLLFVSQSAPPGGNGLSWGTAYNDLQQAINHANATRGIVQAIWVAEGTYKPTRRVVQSNPRTAMFLIPDGVDLYGGFVGLESSIDQRDVEHHPTILSGDLMGNDGPDFSGYEDNALHVVVANELYHPVAIDGFTIVGGNAADTFINGINETSGAGVLGIHTSMTIRNCIFLRNRYARSTTTTGQLGVTADAQTTSYGGGGFAAMQYVSNVVSLENCQFLDNYTYATGGGLIIVGGHGTVGNCTFEDNVADYQGGGAGASQFAAVDFQDCTFTSNQSAGRAGGLVVYDSPVHVSQCLFDHNHAPQGGGLAGLYITLMEIDSTCFMENSAVDGGAIVSDGGKVRDSEFTRNHADDYGGAIRYGIDATNCNFVENTAGKEGGAGYTDFYTLSFHSCSFVRNSSKIGGALSYHNQHAAGKIDHSLFFANIATSSGGGVSASGAAQVAIDDSLFVDNQSTFGGALAVGATTLAITNCTLVGNLATSQYGGLYLTSNAPVRNSIFWQNQRGVAPNISMDELAQISYSGLYNYNIVQGWTGSRPGVGNTDADPIFVDPFGFDGIPDSGDENFRLDSSSPAIDAGDPDLTGLSFADLDGRSRVLCGRVDMGAYEFGIEGDANCDGTLDSSDVQDWPGCLTGPGGNIFSVAPLCGSLDINADGHFDLRDISLLQLSIDYP
ncbi:MAG: FG-GAP repeat protein [Planctomycetes bacterium]|nr:FG-GAP repeat protein [Planctomycetota bacterium]MBI3833276.1 FG-GAP repeat protein [Planctomycetota bacterium]